MVTRKPKRKFKVGALIRNVVLPLAAIGALAGAILWPPSHQIIFEGPLKPLIVKAQPVAEQLARPLHFVAQQQTITDKNRQIQVLNQQIEKTRKDLASRDDQIKGLQNQLNQAKSGVAAAAAASPPPAANPAGGGAPAQTVAAAGGPAPGSQADPDVKRTATVWAGMDAEAVAALAEKLPVDYVVRVLGQMTPDQVGQVMEALPPPLAAKITQSQGPR